MVLAKVLVRVTSAMAGHSKTVTLGHHRTPRVEQARVLPTAVTGAKVEARTALTIRQTILVPNRML